MKEKGNAIFKIDDEIIKNYVQSINSIKEPMSMIKKQLNQAFMPMKKMTEDLNTTVKLFASQLESINEMSKALNNYFRCFPTEKIKVCTDVIKQIMEANNGMITARMIEPLNISRQCLSIMEKNNDIEKISRGIYISSDAFEDSYFCFQQKYKKAIFSHMNALYFYGMTEEFPYNYTVTVPQSYHVDMVNEKCNVFYVSDEIYEIGITEVDTPNGNKVRVYDKERCICDIIRSKGRMDNEQVKKTIKQYIQCNDKDIAKLSTYAKKMGISKKVMEMVGAYYD